VSCESGGGAATETAFPISERERLRWPLIMCGRFTLTRSAAEVAEHFGLASASALVARWNAAPTQELPIVRVRSSGARVLELRRWGLVPRWAKDVSVGARMINARVESVLERPAFREAMRRRRCLVPADGFFEWQGKARARRPFHIALPGGGLFAIAGLYERWQGPGAEVVDSFSLLTRPAREPVAALHDRMPLIVDPSGYAAWLDPGAPDPAAVLAALPETLGGGLVVRPVSPRVNDVRNDDPACLAPPAEAPLPLFER
jgi:putative SOS response-associated peptidase YedK